ncbi:hypothetical protein OF385_04300 [Glutamicibacter sp. JL.03c]|uniref:hypothetical protein n=1 Tax=Glutamicibacter sp. JL.03c TaxID=2984842 RepID=UPI0021F7F43F|nr:hypothetical protein [Glutamicibacter sp. JL.03c]UYQ78381.1 hypothetical protein OF385_04300 [Glutamicibacter sp. JL.03c]
MWPKANRRKILAQSEEAYLRRLQEIEASVPDPEEWGPSLINIGKGQAEFMGYATKSRFADHYIVVEADGLPTQSGRRERTLDWVEAEQTELLGQITGYWLAILRNSDSQKEMSSGESEHWFETMSALNDFLQPMEAAWYPALQGYQLIEGVGFYSPDWRCGAEPA